MTSGDVYETAGKRQMEALAYLHDNLKYLPGWLGRLTPTQMGQLAALLASWRDRDHEPRPMRTLDDIEKEEYIRALIASDGDVRAAAKALGVAKTTFYRHLRRWGFAACDWRMVYQSAALSAPFRPRLRPEERTDSLSAHTTDGVVSRTQDR